MVGKQCNDAHGHAEVVVVLLMDTMHGVSLFVLLVSLVF